MTPDARLTLNTLPGEVIMLLMLRRSHTPNAPIAPVASDHHDVISAVAQQAGQLGRGAAELDGAIEDAVADGLKHAAEFMTLATDIDRMLASNREIESSTDAGRAAVAQARTSVHQVGDGVKGVVNSLRDVAGAAGKITQIALQTRLVAFNATVEAKRAGEAGAGFAIVAQAVKDLAGQVEQTSKQIMTTMDALDERIGSLAARLSNDTGKSSPGDFHQALMRVETAVDVIAGNVQRNVDGCDALVREVRDMSGEVTRSAKSLQQVGTVTRQFLTASEQLIELSASCDAETVDTPFIEQVRVGAEELSRALETAIASGRVTMEALFDQHYRPIANSNPAQYMTGFVALTDELFPAVQERMLAMDGRIVFCAAVDRNGFLPTHNKKFSRPPGPDPVWNAAHCRNRRIFADRTGLAAGRSERPFLLQTYRRDMGAGVKLVMKDLSAPIRVGGRHWGGLRLAYSF